MTSNQIVPSPHLVRLVADALGLASSSEFAITSTTDVNQGRGVFSDVVRVEVESSTGQELAAWSLVVKSPASGPAGNAARASGACRREALAYENLLGSTPVRSPRFWLASHHDDGGVDLVLEDLSGFRRVDQLDGLEVSDALSTVRSLRRLHDAWSAKERLQHLIDLDVRQSTPASFDPVALDKGVKALSQTWASALSSEQFDAFCAMAARRKHLIDVFNQNPPTLCHGDPRADNLVFDSNNEPVLFDWQQISIQPGAADLAWLAATSLDPAVRRDCEHLLIDSYGTTMTAYRQAMVLPGLAVLLLAQRPLDDARTRLMVSTSLDRIGSALVDLAVADQ